MLLLLYRLPGAGCMCQWYIVAGSRRRERERVAAKRSVGERWRFMLSCSERVGRRGESICRKEAWRCEREGRKFGGVWCGGLLRKEEMVWARWVWRWKPGGMGFSARL